MRFHIAVLGPVVLLAGVSCVPNESLVAPSFSACEGAVPQVVRVASYNVKSGMETTLDKVGDTIEDFSPDVLALEEVDRDEDRTGKVDQAQVLADRLGYQVTYAATIDRSGGTYGIALLSRLPFQSVKRIDLRAPFAYEPRVAIDAVLCAGSLPLHVIATHADVVTPSANVETLAKLLEGNVSAGTIVLGDLNQTKEASGVKHLRSAGLVDLLGELNEGPTFWPSGKRLDYVWVDPKLRDVAVDVQIGTSKASDHFPVWADLALAKGFTSQP